MFGRFALALGVLVGLAGSTHAQTIKYLSGLSAGATISTTDTFSLCQVSAGCGLGVPLVRETIGQLDAHMETLFRPLTIITIPLSAAQIRTLHSSPISIVPAPGLGHMIHPLFSTLELKFGTTAFAPTGSSVIQLNFHGTGTFVTGSLNNPLIQAVSSFTQNEDINFDSAFPTTDGNNNSLDLTAMSDFLNGPIATSTLNVGGAGYAIGDTGTISTGNGDATYAVDTVNGGGAVLTYHLTSLGTDYGVGTNIATQVSTGGGDGNFTINITSVTPGDGTGRYTLWYMIDDLMP